MTTPNEQAGSTDITDVSTLYSEDIRIDFEEELQHMVGDLWGSQRNIDWSEQEDLDNGLQNVMIDLATQFHYNNMAELSLCGSILEQEHLLEAKMIASIIAVSKIRNIGTWNKYLSQAGTFADIPDPEQDYFDTLAESDNTESMLLGMSVIGKITWMALSDQLNDLEDPVFQQIIDQVRQQKIAKLELVEDYLEKAIDQMDQREKEDLCRDARYYRGQARETVLYHHKSLDELGKDTQVIADHVEDEITAFFLDIGLDI